MPLRDLRGKNYIHHKDHEDHEEKRKALCALFYIT